MMDRGISQQMYAEHAWQSTGSFNIKVRAKDIHGEESDWSKSLPVTMPRKMRSLRLNSIALPLKLLIVNVSNRLSLPSIEKTAIPLFVRCLLPICLRR